MLSYSQKSFLLSSVWLETEYTWGLIWKKSLLIRCESYQGSSEDIEHFANG